MPQDLLECDHVSPGMSQEKLVPYEDRRGRQIVAWTRDKERQLGLPWLVIARQPPRWTSLRGIELYSQSLTGGLDIDVALVFEWFGS